MARYKQIGSDFDARVSVSRSVLCGKDTTGNHIWEALLPGPPRGPAARATNDEARVVRYCAMDETVKKVSPWRGRDCWETRRAEITCSAAPSSRW